MQCWGEGGRARSRIRAVEVFIRLPAYGIGQTGRTYTRYTEHEAAVNSRGLLKGECQLSARLWGAYRLSVTRAQTASDTADTIKEHFNTRRYLTFLRGC
jgi:hypothetical protein